MADQQLTTNDSKKLEALRVVAHLRVDEADYPTLISFLSPSEKANGAKASPATPKKSSSGNGEVADEIIAKYKPGFILALELGDQEPGIKLGRLLEKLRNRAASPFRAYPDEKCIPWLARNALRNKRLLDPHGKPATATANTTVWTRGAFAKHHSLDAPPVTEELEAQEA